MRLLFSSNSFIQCGNILYERFTFYDCVPNDSDIVEYYKQSFYKDGLPFQFNYKLYKINFLGNDIKNVVISAIRHLLGKHFEYNYGQYPDWKDAAVYRFNYLGLGRTFYRELGRKFDIKKFDPIEVIVEYSVNGWRLYHVPDLLIFLNLDKKIYEQQFDKDTKKLFEINSVLINEVFKKSNQLTDFEKIDIINNRMLNAEFFHNKNKML